MNKMKYLQREKKWQFWKYYYFFFNPDTTTLRGTPPAPSQGFEAFNHLL